MIFICFFLWLSSDWKTKKFNKTNIFAQWEELGFLQAGRSHMVLVSLEKLSSPGESWVKWKTRQFKPQQQVKDVQPWTNPDPVPLFPVSRVHHQFFDHHRTLSGAREGWGDRKEEKLQRERQGGVVDRSFHPPPSHRSHLLNVKVFKLQLC